jgi:hypothetical protein
MKKVDAYYFSTDDKVLQHGDGRKIVEGKTHKAEGNIILCRNGLHASRHPMDALDYAKGSILWKVELSGKILEDNDKLVASKRKYIKGINFENELRLFARNQAIKVISLWDAPDIVIRFLNTGDESIRDAAWDATWDAVRDAVRDAFRTPAWEAARAAARDAAWEAARATTAWEAARDATWEAAMATAWDAVRDATWEAARAAAWADVRDAAWEAARHEFFTIVKSKFK